MYPTAFYFDRAVATFGGHLESELMKADEGKRSAQSKSMRKQMILKRYLGEEPKYASPQRR